MRARLGGLAIGLSLLHAGLAHGADRVLAQSGSEVRITISKSFKCGPEAEIKLLTRSAAYFDLGAETIQRLVNTSRTVLEFECPTLTRLKLTGLTDGTVVFEADAEKKKRWALQTAPAPLEALALFLSLRPPDFFYLATGYGKAQDYRKVPGIEDAYQYKALDAQIRRLAQVVDGDTEKFRSYLRGNGRSFEDFNLARQHYQEVLKAIEVYVPDKAPAYRAVFAEESSRLQEHFWASQVDRLFEDARPFGEIVSAAAALAKQGNPEFRQYIDAQLADWAAQESDIILAGIDDAPLEQVAWAAAFVAGLPKSSDIKGFPETAAAIAALETGQIPQVTKRAEGLRKLAAKRIGESGDGVEDVDAVLDTGFELAADFEEAGFVDAGRLLLAETVAHIDRVVASDLENYKRRLLTLDWTAETAASLQEQAALFEKLSGEFKGFVAYKEAAEEALEKNRSAICRNVLGESGIGGAHHDTSIRFNGDAISLLDLACDLYGNQHRITAFSPGRNSGEYSLTIVEADGATKSEFRLEPEEARPGAALRVVQRVGDNPATIDDQEWNEYVARLSSVRPSGAPDAQGLRLCDKLAADPYDPRKLAGGIDLESADAESFDFDRALDACIAAVEDAPDDARQRFQLGRLLWHAGDQESGRRFIDMASAAKYPAADYYRAEILLATSADQNSFVDALQLFEASGKAGYARGLQMVKELNPEGIAFFKEIPPPTPDELVAALPHRALSYTVLGMTASSRITGARIKECFQVSATDFFCEYRVSESCSFSSGMGNDPFSQLMSSLAQAECNDAAADSFAKFRRIGKGQWRKIADD